MLRSIVAGLLLGLGLFMFLSDVIGLYKFRYILNRIHAAALGDTLGIFFIIAAVAVLKWDLMVSLKLLLVLVFMFFTGPTVTHLIAEAEVFYHGCPKGEYSEEDRT